MERHLDIGVATTDLVAVLTGRHPIYLVTPDVGVTWITLWMLAAAVPAALVAASGGNTLRLLKATALMAVVATVFSWTTPAGVRMDPLFTVGASAIVAEHLWRGGTLAWWRAAAAGYVASLVGILVGADVRLVAGWLETAPDNVVLVIGGGYWMDALVLGPAAATVVVVVEYAAARVRAARAGEPSRKKGKPRSKKLKA